MFPGGFDLVTMLQDAEHELEGGVTILGIGGLGRHGEERVRSVRICRRWR